MSMTSGRPRRTRVPEKPHYPLNLWSIMKNCIGKELSKIPMPVNFSEPLSMLQRLAEDFEYANILDKVCDFFNFLFNGQKLIVLRLSLRFFSKIYLSSGK